MTAETSPAPMISIAGIRGIVGESLRLDEFINYAQAFMAGLKPRKIVIGGDTRPSGEMMRHLVFAAAIASGLEVFDLGIVPTPTVGLMVRNLRAGGGIVISASHNPPQWNAFKFFSSEGTFLKPDQFAELLENYRAKKFRRAPVKELGRVERVKDPIGPHLEAILQSLPVAEIRKQKFNVVLDACNGAGLGLAEALFKALKVNYSVILSAQDGKFEREPEPLPQNLGKLKKAVIEAKADIGFALDPDADRLAIVDETGHPIGEERTVTLAMDYVLQHSKKPVVVNLSTTRAVEDVALKHGVKVERTAIGEAHVVNRMKELKSEIGGEGNGGVIFPRVHFGRDSATGIALILALMSSRATGKRKVPLSEINSEIPDYAILKDKVSLADRALIAPAVQRLLENLSSLKSEFPNEDPILDQRDGLKISLRNRWLHVRASGTEPIMRLFAEAPTKAGAARLLEWAKSALAV